MYQAKNHLENSEGRLDVVDQFRGFARLSLSHPECAGLAQTRTRCWLNCG